MSYYLKYKRSTFGFIIVLIHVSMETLEYLIFIRNTENWYYIKALIELEFIF